jgi:nitroreductase
MEEKSMLKVLNTRRSVRSFKSDPVSDSDIREILETAMNAPSAGDERAWQFVILTDQKVRQNYAEFNKNVSSIVQSPVAILICGDTRAQKYDGYYMHDCCAATENILLAIHAKGLGGFWGNVFPAAIPQIQKLLNIPEHIIPFSVVPLGYPAKTPVEPKTRFDETRIHFNGW